MENTEVADRAVRAMREHREDMARWLALEVLMSDELVEQDKVLWDRLSVLQEMMEERLREITRT
jgi:hypothetical protein